MNKGSQNIYNNNVIELDLVDLLWRLLAQWKAILLFAVIMAFVAVFLGYKMDQRKYENAIREESKKKKENLSPSEEMFLKNEYGKSAVEILQALDEEDRIPVMNLLRQEKTLKDQKEYFSDSVYMNLNPKHVKRLSMGYIINCKNGKDDKYVNMLIKEYRNIVLNEELLDNIKKEMGLSIDTGYIKELVSVDGDISVSSAEKAGIDNFYVNVMIPEGVKDTSGIEKAIDNAIRAFHDNLSKSIAAHDVNLIQTRDLITSDSGVLVAQTDMLNRINSMVYNINTNKNSLQGNQSKAYELIKNQSQTPEIDKGQVDYQNLSEMTKPGYSLKYLILGMFAGIFLYVMSYIVFIMIKGNYYSSVTLQTLTNSRLLGCIHFKEENKGLKLLTGSPMIEGIRYGSRGDEEIQTGNAISEIVAFCHYNRINEIILMGCSNLADRVTSNIADIERKLIEQGIASASKDVDQLKTDDDNSPSSILLVVQKDISRVKDIRKSVDQTSAYGLSVFGVIYYD